MADSSELGWRLVKEYEAHPITSDNDDEKWIFKAEVRATRKMKSEKSERGCGSYRAWPYRRRRYMEPSSTQTTAAAAETKKPGLCFGCSLPDNWKKECPPLRNSNNKILFSKNVLMSQDINSAIGGAQGISPIISGVSVFKPVNTVDGQVNSACQLKDQGKEEIVNHGNISDILPIGRLKAANEKWKETGVSRYILSVIEEGYKLTFKTFPPSACIHALRTISLLGKMFPL